MKGGREGGRFRAISSFRFFFPDVLKHLGGKFLGVKLLPDDDKWMCLCV